MIRRNAHNLVIKTIEDKQIPIIIGMRRIGKTTLLKQLEKELKNAYYISFDDFDYTAMNDIEFWNFIKDLAEKYDYLLLDEIQERKSWDLIIKNLFDKYVAIGKCNVVATGSSSLNLLGKELGVNRTKRIYLDTWDFDEYLKLTKKDKSFEVFEKFLGFGFPDYMNHQKGFNEMLNETLRPIIKNDLIRAYPQTDSDALIRLIKCLSALSNGELNETDMALKVGITRITLRGYLDILENALLIKRVYRIDQRLIQPKKKVSKIYINPHFHIWLLGREFQHLDAKFKGHIIESYWLHWTQSLSGWSKTFYYYKNLDSNEEIDFVSLDNDGTIKSLHEFKYSDSFTLNKTFKTTPSKIKIVWCKATGTKENYKMISILDINSKKEW